jgi:hypothetical protein
VTATKILSFASNPRLLYYARPKGGCLALRWRVCKGKRLAGNRFHHMLFIIPLIIFVVGYGLALWFSATGRRFVRRFFFLPVLVSLAITLYVSSRFEHNRLTPLPGHTLAAEPGNPVHFLPLYALRVAPIALGGCLIVNAAAYYVVGGLRRRFRRPPQPVPTGE